MSYSVGFLTKKGLLECKPEWNGEATTVFSRLPSLKRLQATPPLQISLCPVPLETLLTSNYQRKQLLGIREKTRKEALSEKVHLKIFVCNIFSFDTFNLIARQLHSFLKSRH